jgi:EAL domain-containing protein (putative c-di-GMP-specific phosphodiesterase class I)
MKEIRKPFRINGNELNISTSLGISVCPDDGREIDTLLRYADIAMYYAKAHGRNTFQYYNPVINTSSLERIDLENRLRRAIERNELRLYFQPLVNVGTGKMVSVEILVRWHHPEQGMLLPAQFLKTADEIGLLPDIDEWVLTAAGGQIKTWLNEGLHPVCITVNLSARQFQRPDLVARISGILEETGLPPECLDLEITETTAMDNIDNTIEQLRELTSMGIHISIDDFGTGYSSLSYLKKLPIDRLKIDQSFVRDIVRDPDDRAIISAVTSMARSMGIRTVAEGVETEEQLSFLRASGCDEAQGFLFSRPLTAEKFRELVESGR